MFIKPQRTGRSLERHMLVKNVQKAFPFHDYTREEFLRYLSSSLLLATQVHLGKTLPMFIFILPRFLSGFAEAWWLFLFIHLFAYGKSIKEYQGFLLKGTLHFKVYKRLPPEGPLYRIRSFFFLSFFFLSGDQCSI